MQLRVPDLARRRERKRERLVQSKRLRTGVQTDVRRAMVGEVRSANVDDMQESEHESDGSEEEGAGARSNADPEAEARVAEAVRLEEEGRKRRAARMRMLAERGRRQRQAARALRLTSSRPLRLGKRGWLA